MALNRQKILNELGSVMNQLQSADCGCMGKLFNQPGQHSQPIGNPFPSCGGCRRSCNHGCCFSNMPNASSGEPCAGTGQPGGYHCMGHCNPPKLYADTYNYLNSNLMQPVVKEVYDDLKSINPTNTVMNNPLGNQMGLSSHQPNAANMSGQNLGHSHVNPEQIQQNSVQNMNAMHGMGPQIMNMVGGAANAKPVYAERQGAFGETLGHMNPQETAFGKTETVQNPLSNNLTGQTQQVNQFAIPNSYMRPNVQNADATKPLNNLNGSPAEQQMSAPPHYHGQHTQGISKFKEMFPGVMQGLGGDLGFDPMTIAIQMNPANQHQVAMDTMHKLVNDKTGLNKMFNAAGNTGMSQPESNISSVNNPNRYFEENTQGKTVSNSIPQEQVPHIQSNSQPQFNLSNAHNLQEHGKLGNDVTNTNTQPYQTNQQIYSMKETPVTNFQQSNQDIIQNQPQKIVEPNITTNNLPTIHEGTLQNQVPSLQAGDNYVNETKVSQQMIKDPIFPVDNSKYKTYIPPRHQRYYDYNTLGQPIETLPAKMYHTSEPGLPQTLSPQPVPYKSFPDPVKYNNVKSTISKTSIVQNRPIGKTPSKSQLQQIYNQYKGSQSFTQQNVRASEGFSHSDGRLNVPQNNIPAFNQAPIEKTGGDSTANNQIQSLHGRQQMGQIGDVSSAEKYDPNIPEKTAPILHKKCRNGLQDMIYTTYPTSTAWSFHGHGRDVYSSGNRYRNRI